MATKLTKDLDCIPREVLEKESMTLDCNDDVAKRVVDPCALSKLDQVIAAIQDLELSGGGGVSNVKDYISDEATISANRAVVISDSGLGNVKYTQPTDTMKIETIGISISAASMGGVVRVQCDGFLSDGSFSSFTVGCPVFATVDGMLVNSMPALENGEYVLRVGRYVGHNTIEIEIEEPQLISLCS